jgi:tRNA synthetases class I (M)
MSTAVLTAVAWAYKNGARHIGHKSGSGVASGVFARCHRMAGNRVLMVSGTDEPQGLPEVDAPFASGESVVSFQRRATIGPRTAGPSGPGGGEGRRRSDTLLRRVQDRPRTVFA